MKTHETKDFDLTNEVLDELSLHSVSQAHSIITIVFKGDPNESLSMPAESAALLLIGMIVARVQEFHKLPPATEDLRESGWCVVQCVPEPTHKGQFCPLRGATQPTLLRAAVESLAYAIKACNDHPKS